LYVFFFQAEDGIRDFHVTGVQTCALPIFASAGECAWAAGRSYCDFAERRRGVWPTPARGGGGGACAEHEGFAVEGGAGSLETLRSEERRVGKACRIGGASIDSNKTENPIP